MNMHHDSIDHQTEGLFDQFVGKAKAVYGDLTDDDVAKWNGNMQQAKGWLQEKYGDAEEKLSEFWNGTNENSETE